MFIQKHDIKSNYNISLTDFWMNTSYQFKSKLFKRYFKAVFLLLAIDSPLFADRMISTHNKTMNWVVKVSTQLFIKRADENTSQRSSDFKCRQRHLVSLIIFSTLASHCLYAILYFIIRSGWFRLRNLTRHILQTYS